MYAPAGIPGPVINWVLAMGKGPEGEDRVRVALGEPDVMYPVNLVATGVPRVTDVNVVDEAVYVM